MTEANKIRRMKEATQPNFKRWTEVTKCRVIHTEGWREATQPTFNRWTQVTKCRRIRTEGWKEKSHTNRSYQIQKLSNRRLKINIQRLHKIQWKNCKLPKLLSSFFLSNLMWCIIFKNLQYYLLSKISLKIKLF